MRSWELFVVLGFDRGFYAFSAGIGLNYGFSELNNHCAQDAWKCRMVSMHISPCKQSERSTNPAEHNWKFSTVFGVTSCTDFVGPFLVVSQENTFLWSRADSFGNRGYPMWACLQNLDRPVTIVSSGSIFLKNFLRWPIHRFFDQRSAICFSRRVEWLVSKQSEGNRRNDWCLQAGRILNWKKCKWTRRKSVHTIWCWCFESSVFFHVLFRAARWQFVFHREMNLVEEGVCTMTCLLRTLMKVELMTRITPRTPLLPTPSTNRHLLEWVSWIFEIRVSSNWTENRILKALVLDVFADQFVCFAILSSNMVWDSVRGGILFWREMLTAFDMFVDCFCHVTFCSQCSHKRNCVKYLHHVQ